MHLVFKTSTVSNKLSGASIKMPETPADAVTMSACSNASPAPFWLEPLCRRESMSGQIHHTGLC